MGSAIVGAVWLLGIGLAIWFGYAALKATFTGKAPDARPNPSRGVARPNEPMTRRRLIDGHRPWQDPRDQRSAAIQDRFIRGQFDEATYERLLQAARATAA